MKQPSPIPNDAQAGELKRELRNRHVQLIAIGGCIGTGLFMGSGKTISMAGPSVLLVYSTIGIMLFFMMRAMGELLLSDLSYKSFADFAEDILGPWAGFTTGWSYWFAWITTAMAEIIAISGYFNFWWPDLPTWIPAISTVLLLLTVNLVTVRAFGEIEFWFALIKIVAILALIAVGLVLVFIGFTSPEGYTASLSNLWNHGGFFPKGTEGVLDGFRTAVFAFVGMEVVGITAAEVRDPKSVLPKAINTIPIRILTFYLGTLVVLMMVTPWQHIPSESSPFVGMFSLAGFVAAASVINFVVVTSAMSSANSGTYSTSRMLYGLAKQGDAAKWLGRLSSRGVPANGLFTAGLFLFSAVVILAKGGSVMDAFQLVTSVASLLFIFVWSMIVLSYLVYRRRRPELHLSSNFKMPGGQFMAYVLLVFFGFLLVTLGLDPESRSAMLILPIWFIGLAITYFTQIRSTHEHRNRRVDHQAKIEDEALAATKFRKNKTTLP
jgi:D-serine/D-alanine/glycine transporter